MATHRALGRILGLLLIALFALVTPIVPSRAGAAPPPYLVIVHPNNPARVLSRSFVADAFLKKTTRWPDGSVIHPVDLAGDNAARERFSEDVIKRSVAAVRSYWQQSIFTGRDVPPPELANDDEIIKYVLKTPHAIGYVSGAAHATDVKVVSLE
jgi:ABC-type phosphate transport system substrate-binding protein